jgi:hypothetical protein
MGNLPEDMYIFQMRKVPLPARACVFKMDAELQREY